MKDTDTLLPLTGSLSLLLLLYAATPWLNENTRSDLEGTPKPGPLRL